MSNQLTIKDTLKQQESHFAALLKASGTDVNRFMNNAIMATNDHPDIQSGAVDRASVFKVCSRAANDGVVLDGKQAAMVIGWNGKTKQKEAQYRLMAGGVMAMINRSPSIKRLICQVMYENDIKKLSFVTGSGEPPITHEINFDAPTRGEALGVYAAAELEGGEWIAEWMSVAEVNEVRDNYSSKDKDGNFSKMWTQSWGEAARKTVLHRIKKRLPLTERIEQSLAQDDDFELQDVTPEVEAPAPAAAPKKRASSKDAVKAAIVQQAPVTVDVDGVIEEEPQVIPSWLEADYEEQPPL